MTPAQLAVAKIISRAVREAGDYLRNDQRASYPLRRPVYVVLRDNTLAALCKDFRSADGALAIENRGDGLVKFLAGVFPRSANLWNGPDILRNKHLRRMLASLFHDLIWGHREELAAAWGLSVEEVLHLGNIVLFEVWMWASKDSWWGRIEARVAYQACELGKGWYHTAKKTLAVVALALVASGCEGCYSYPDGFVVEVYGEEEVQDVMDLYGDGLEDPEEAGDGE